MEKFIVYFGLLIGIALAAASCSASNQNYELSTKPFEINYQQKIIPAYDRKLSENEVFKLTERAQRSECTLYRLSNLGIAGNFWFDLNRGNLILVYNKGSDFLSVPEMSEDFTGGLLSIAQCNKLESLIEYLQYLLDNEIHQGGNKIADHRWARPYQRKSVVDYSYGNYRDTF